MAGNIKLQTGTHTSCVSSGGSLTSGSAVAANGANNIANGTNFDRRLSFVLVVGFGSSPAVNAEIQLYLAPALDGTNFPDEDTTTPLLNPDQYAGSFWITLAQTATQRLVVEGIQVGPYTYKPYIWNKTAQTMSSGWTLDAYGDQDQYT